MPLTRATACRRGEERRASRADRASRERWQSVQNFASSFRTVSTFTAMRRRADQPRVQHRLRPKWFHVGMPGSDNHSRTQFLHGRLTAAMRSACALRSGDYLHRVLKPGARDLLLCLSARRLKPPRYRLGAAARRPPVPVGR